MNYWSVIDVVNISRRSQITHRKKTNFKYCKRVIEAVALWLNEVVCGWSRAGPWNFFEFDY